MKKKVLVVDDEDLLRELLVQTIKNSGYTVEQAKDGAIALEMYKNLPSGHRHHGCHHAPIPTVLLQPSIF